MIEFPPFRLDTVNECLWQRRDSGADERILLPPKAFFVLRYLVEHAGRLVTEDELLRAVWPKAYVQPEAVKAQIYTLRRVLGDDARAPRYIETLPRRGYQFIATTEDRLKADATVTATRVHRPLVGRDRALAELRTGMLVAAGGRRQIVFVTGEPGIGKTALLDELQRQTVRDFPSIRIARGQCIEGYGGMEAYFPMLEALGHLSAGPAAASIIETLALQAPTWLVQFPAFLKPEHRKTLQREIEGATRERMLREICVALETLVLQIPLLLIFEDMQWGDHATVDLISALARRRAVAKLLLVVTTRPFRSLLPAHPLKTLSQDLLVHRLCKEIVLEPLTESDVAAYLATDSTTKTPPNGLVDLIHGHTEGNPLFMVAALDYLVQRGFIWRENGSWQLRVPLEELDLGVPETLRQMMEAQIERLSTEEQRALEAASVLGTAFEVAVGAAAAAIVVDEFEDICARLARRQDILRERFRESPNESYEYQFVHALYRDVFYQRQSPTRRARIHLRCGDWLELQSDAIVSDAAATLAHHFEEAGSWERAVKYLQLSAEIATGRLAHREAASILRQALGLVDKLPPTMRNGTEIAVLRSLCSILEADLLDVRAIEFYDLLVEKSERYGLVEDHVRALNDMAGLVSRVDNQRCIRLLDLAIELAPQISDPVLRMRELAASHIKKIILQGWTQKDEAHCREWIEQARPQLSTRELAPLLLQFSWMLVHVSRYRAALAAAEEALATFDANFSGQRNTLGYLAKQHALEFLGEWGLAIRWSEEIAAILVKNGYSARASSIMLIRPRIDIHADNCGPALQFLESVLPSFVETKLIPLIRYCQSWIALASARLGDIDRAMRLLVMLEEDLARVALPADLTFRPNFEWAFVEAFLAARDYAKADVHYRRWVTAAERVGEVTWQGFAWEAGARIALARGDMRVANVRLSSACAVIQGYEAPLAAWKIHATAADLEELCGHHSAAADHRRISGATARSIAESLPETEPTRAAFLASARVQRVLTTS